MIQVREGTLAFYKARWLHMTVRPTPCFHMAYGHYGGAVLFDSARVMKECRPNASGQGLDGGRSGVDIISARPDPDGAEKGEARAAQWRSISAEVSGMWTRKCSTCGGLVGSVFSIQLCISPHPDAGPRLFPKGFRFRLHYRKLGKGLSYRRHANSTGAQARPS